MSSRAFMSEVGGKERCNWAGKQVPDILEVSLPHIEDRAFP